MGIAVFMLLLFAALAAGGAWFLRNLRAELAVLRTEAGAQLAERNAVVDRRLEAMTSTLDRRLESTSQTAGEIQRRLGELGRANEEILSRANDLSGSRTRCGRRRRAAASASFSSRTSSATGFLRARSPSSTASQA